MERCPCCNARLRERSICSRCKADLNALIHSEQAAQVWLAKAIQRWGEGNIEQSISALESSLALKNTPIALAFRGFIIHQYSQKILVLLVQKQLLVAKQALYKARTLLPYSQSLQKINAFTDYLIYY